MEMEKKGRPLIREKPTGKKRQERKRKTKSIIQRLVRKPAPFDLPVFNL
ncbi:MAG: hypothetical protein WAW52_09965 [Methanothrix sp.]